MASLIAAAVLGAAATPAAAAPAPPFNQCPPVGADDSCGVLIVVGDTGTMVFADPTVIPFDRSEDTLVGILNDSSRPLGSLPLQSDQPIFGFEGYDGICSPRTTGATPPGCPFGPTGYEGPNTSFVAINDAKTAGTVNFPAPIPPGGSAYFGLEGTPHPGDVAPGPPSPQPATPATGAVCGDLGSQVDAQLAGQTVASDLGRGFAFSLTSQSSLGLRVVLRAKDPFTGSFVSLANFLVHVAGGPVGLNGRGNGLGPRFARRAAGFLTAVERAQRGLILFRIVHCRPDKQTVSAESVGIDPLRP